MSHFLLFLIGVAVGTILTKILLDIRTGYGTLEIDQSDPEKDMYNLRVGDLDSLAKKKRVLFKITHK